MFNKSKGKTLECAAVDLRAAAFVHGQLYVALSRVRIRQNIRLLCDVTEMGGPEGTWEACAERFRAGCEVSLPVPVNAAPAAAAAESVAPAAAPEAAHRHGGGGAAPLAVPLAVLLAMLLAVLLAVLMQPRPKGARRVPSVAEHLQQRAHMTVTCVLPCKHARCLQNGGATVK